MSKSETEKERIAASINERASNKAYFIANAIVEGDVGFANEEFREEVESYSNGSGGAGVTLVKLQAVGLIDILNQESLNVLDDNDMEIIIQTLEASLPDKSIAEKYKAMRKPSHLASK